MKDETALKIDLQEVLRERLPNVSRFIPRGLVRWAERTICQDEMNRIMEDNRGLEGADFCRGVFRSLDLKYDVHNSGLLPPPDNRRVVFISNHPLGALDGLALIDYVQSRYGGQVWFVVNDLLMHVKPLAPVFLPINKFGSQSRSSSVHIDEAFAGNDPIIIFPAGLVSRLQKDGRTIRDLEWKKMFVNKSRIYRRDIVPMYVDAHNSMHFYKVAWWRKLLRLKFNIEQIYLPQEIFSLRGGHFSIYAGEPVPWSALPAARDAKAFACRMREYVYSIPRSVSPDND